MEGHEHLGSAPGDIEKREISSYEPPPELEALLRAETELAQRSHVRGKGEERVLNWADEHAADFREFWGKKAPQRYILDHYADPNQRWMKPVVNEWKRFLAEKKSRKRNGDSSHEMPS